MQNPVKRCPLPFPTWEYNTRLKLYETKETEADGTTEELIYEGPAVYKAETRRHYANGSGGAKEFTETFGRFVVHGDIAMSDPANFHGFVEYAQAETKTPASAPVFSISKPMALGAVFSTEITVGG